MLQQPRAAHTARTRQHDWPTAPEHLGECLEGLFSPDHLELRLLAILLFLCLLEVWRLELDLGHLSRRNWETERKRLSLGLDVHKLAAPEGHTHHELVVLSRHHDNRRLVGRSTYERREPCDARLVCGTRLDENENPLGLSHCTKHTCVAHRNYWRDGRARECHGCERTPLPHREHDSSILQQGAGHRQCRTALIDCSLNKCFTRRHVVSTINWVLGVPGPASRIQSLPRLTTARHGIKAADPRRCGAHTCNTTGHPLDDTHPRLSR